MINNPDFTTRYYKVAGHSFTVAMPCSEQGIAMPSYEPFAVDAERAGGLLFALTVDDTFYPSAKGALIGGFECGAADCCVCKRAPTSARLPSPHVVMMVCVPLL